VLLLWILATHLTAEEIAILDLGYQITYITGL